jgi:glucose/arabinose dehydrogenase
VYPDGTIDTFAGMGPGDAGYAGDGGPATAARLNKPRDVAADADGNIFIADSGNHVIRMVDTNGIISTAVGVFRQPISPDPTVNPISSCALHDEQGAPALEVHLTRPYGVDVDTQGNLWIADTRNNVIRILYR